MNVDFAQLRCRSAFEIAAGEPTIVSLPESPRGTGSVIRVTSLPNVIYLPSVLEPGQSVCVVNRDTVPEESILDAWSLTFLQTQRRDQRFCDTYAGDIAADAVDETVCILGNLFSRNFGHWTEELLKVAVLERAGVNCRYVMPTLSEFARASLHFLGIDDARILTVDRPAIFARAVFTSAVHHGNIADFPQVLSLWREKVAARLGSQTSRFGPRLWLERDAMVRSGGVTMNRDEVYPLLEAAGFDIVDMAALAIADQFATARAATVIAGPHGSQFVHAQFMPEGSTVIECFSPVHVNPSILQICEALGHRYHQIVARSHLIAPYAFGRDCQVDCEHLKFALSRLS